MAINRISIFSLFVIFILLAPEKPLSAQQPVPPRPQNRRTLRGAPDNYPLGGLGAEVDKLTPAQAEAKGIKLPGSVILIRKVFPGEPAQRAGLKAGDLIIGVGTRGLPLATAEEVLTHLEAAIEKTEKSKRKKLELTLFRDGQQEKIKVSIPTLGAHHRSNPGKCKKCTAILRKSLDYLVKVQSGEGYWDSGSGGTNGKVAVTSLAGQALALGRKLRITGCSNALKKATSYILRNAGNEPMLARINSNRGNWSQVNWALSYATIFLCTAHGKTLPGKVKAKVISMVKQLEKNQEASGGWAHGPGGPNALGYLELEIVSNQALLAFHLARRAGVKVPEECIKKGVSYVVACTTGGGVAYSNRPGQAGHGDAGRTAGAWLALDLLGMGPKRSTMSKFFIRNLAKLPSGHVSPIMHITAASMASYRHGKRTSARFWQLYRPYLMVSRTTAGAFGARPTRETKVLKSNSDRNMGPFWTTANFCLTMEATMGMIPWLKDK